MLAKCESSVRCGLSKKKKIFLTRSFGLLMLLVSFFTLLLLAVTVVMKMCNLMALIDIVPDFPLWSTFQHSEFGHKWKSATTKSKMKACALRALPVEASAFTINLFYWKLCHISLVLSCSFSFPTENIFLRFIFHLFLCSTSDFLFPSPPEFLVCAGESGRGNIMRSFFASISHRMRYIIGTRTNSSRKMKEGKKSLKVNISTDAHEFLLFK